MANLSSKTGTVTTPVQAQISLANNSATAVQDMSAYDSQEVTGFVYVDATADLRCSFSVQVVKNGAGTYEIAASDQSGDNYLGAPLLTFSMSGSVLRVTLPNVAGFTSAYLRYQLSAPYLGGNYPLSVDGSQVVSGTVAAARLGVATAGSSGAISYYEENDTVSSTFTFNGTSGGTSGAVTLRCTRVGRLVSVCIDGTVAATTGTSSTQFAANTAIPAAFRPSAQVYGLVGARQGGVNLDTGRVTISTGGIITIFKTGEAVAWTNTTADSGLSGGLFISYRV